MSLLKDIMVSVDNRQQMIEKVLQLVWDDLRESEITSDNLKRLVEFKIHEAISDNTEFSPYDIQFIVNQVIEAKETSTTPSSAKVYHRDYVKTRNKKYRKYHKKDETTNNSERT